MVFAPISTLQLNRLLTVLQRRKERVSFLMVNTKHDTHSYESTKYGESGYQREIFNPNALYSSYLKAKRNSDWKPQVQKYEMNLLPELSKLYSELKNKTLKFLPSKEFVLKERGRIRVITGEQIHDRIAKGCLCDEELLPSVNKYLIHDNGASLKGKGIDFSRRRIEAHLRKYYSQNQTNEGYVLLIDFRKYFDNIRHKEFVSIFENLGIDETALWLLKKTVEKSRVDVSYMTDSEYKKCMDIVFNSLEHQEIPKSKLDGSKLMEKHLNIGDVVAQVAGIAYPIQLDNYIKIVEGVKFYARYMDDSYIIHSDKEYLKGLLDRIIKEADKLGITVNENKTRICKLSSYWRFLQIQYSLTNTGRVVKKIHPKRLTDMRRKMKKLAPVLTEKEFNDFYTSWFNNHYKIMSKQQRENMNELYQGLRKV